jgi:hypothetical protein
MDRMWRFAGGGIAVCRADFGTEFVFCDGGASCGYKLAAEDSLLRPA